MTKIRNAIKYNTIMENEELSYKVIIINFKLTYNIAI